MVLLLALPAQLASAAPAPKSKVVAALITAAQKEFDAANFQRAGELFLDIWKADKDSRPALYNAARAFHLAGKLDKSEELYNEFLALPEVDAATQQKIRGQLNDIRQKRAEQKADEASNAEKDGEFATAAGLWAEANSLQPGKFAWRLREARAQHRAGKKQAALHGYERYLAEAPADAPGRNLAQSWREELEPPQAAMPLVVQPAPEVAPDRPILGYSTLGVGLAGVIAGGIVLGLAKADDASLQDQFAQRNANGRIGTMTYAEAQSRASAIETRYQTGWAVTGVGIVAAGVGTWLVWRHGNKTTVAFDGTGMRLALQF